MMREDEDALICDLAETYGIYDYKALPISLIATLSIGLRADSRIKMKMDGQKVDLKTTLLGAILDNVSYLLWFQTEDGQKGRNRPTLISDVFNSETNKTQNAGYDNPDDFINACKKIRGDE